MEETDNQLFDYKMAFQNIRNFLAGRFVGATRDRALLEEVLKCVFVKNYLQAHKNSLSEVADSLELSKEYRRVFANLKSELPFVFEKNEEIQLDPASIQFVNEQIKNVNFFNSQRDFFGDLFEVFVGSGIREEEGQFFTPQNGIELLIQMIAPQPGEKIIDPAAGAGGFLSAAFNYLLNKGAKSKQINDTIFGIEKDCYLAKLAATRLALRSLKQGHLYCGDSLAWVNQNNKPLKLDHEYDVVLTNPPFGKNIVSVSKTDQKTFELGYEWKKTDKDTYQKSTKLSSNVPPQVLFVERCIKLLKGGGRLGIVLPESLLTSKSYSYVVQFIRNHGRIVAVMGMPEDFFKTSGKGGTHTKACLMIFVKDIDYVPKKNDLLFMAEAKWCGHDSRGRQIDKDDLPLIVENYLKYNAGKKIEPSNLGYTIKALQIEDNILSPRFYNPEIVNLLSSIEATHELVTIRELVDKGIVEIKTGNEIGKMAYGTGSIPFIRTSDISNWEIKIDPKHGVSEDIYESIKIKQDIKENDIFMVKDGTYLIGTCAIVSKYDTKSIYQSHIYKIRVLETKIITPFLLLAILSSDLVQKQIKSKRFTQDIIDSLGSRIYDLLLPIPKDRDLKRRVEKNVKRVVEDRVEARELARIACLEVAGILTD